MARSMPESHTHRIFPGRAWKAEQGSCLRVTIALALGTRPLTDSGDLVMWLVLYVATIASLSALSLLPTTLAPIAVKTDEPGSPAIDL
jgi:hypothetical protein